MKREILPNGEMIKSIEHRGPKGIPISLDFWNYGNTSLAHCRALTEIFNEYPSDVVYYMPEMPGYDASPFPGRPEYTWTRGGALCTSTAADAQIYIGGWDELDACLASFPDPNLPEIFGDFLRRKGIGGREKYSVASFCYFFFERHWSLRGMENALTDYLLYPDEVHRLYRALCEFYKVIVKRSKKELDCNGFFVTDDLGSQDALMLSPGVFREFLKPYYKEIIDLCHESGMHFWLHSCGNITEIMDDLIEIGIDVIHPIQYGAMDQREIVSRYKGRVCFWAGMEMQYVLQNGTEEEVRARARELIETFSGKDGGLIVGFGNGITEDIPPENVRAFTDEAWKHRCFEQKEARR